MTIWIQFQMKSDSKSFRSHELTSYKVSKKFQTPSPTCVASFMNSKKVKKICKVGESNWHNSLMIINFTVSKNFKLGYKSRESFWCAKRGRLNDCYMLCPVVKKVKIFITLTVLQGNFIFLICLLMSCDTFILFRFLPTPTPTHPNPHPHTLSLSCHFFDSYV